MEDDTTEDIRATTGAAGRGLRPALGLVIAWSKAQPTRLGEVAFATQGSTILGRGESAHRLSFARQHPFLSGTPRAIEGRSISREQLRVVRERERLHVENLGRCAMSVNGAPRDEGRLGPGDTLTLHRELVLLCVERPLLFEPLRSYERTRAGGFGEPDDLGILGESPASWRLREQLAFAARSLKHVLLHGPSGSGKELAARAIHALSDRRTGPFVARNAATVPAGVIDAELFGNRKDYPNPGMPQRAGVVGEADHGTLFLDELGELPHELQAHLLRVLDEGEYQRLGEDQRRRADLRLVGATNRDPSELKHDVEARLTLRIELPGLDARREDIPLLARHLMMAAAAHTPELADRFIERGSSSTYPRMHERFVEALLRHRYTHHVRELDRLLWTAMATSPKDRLDLTDDVAKLLDTPSEVAETRASPTRDQVVDALQKAGGNKNRAARELGLENRFALYRLVKKYGIE